MIGDWLEAAIIAVILGGIAVAIFKGGAANPVGTASLGKKLSLLDGDVKALKTQLTGVDDRVTEIDRRGATNADIKRLEGRVDEWERKLERIDERMDVLDREIATIKALGSSNQTVVTAMAESLREATATMQMIDRRSEASAAITAQVPGFIENVLTSVARTIAQTESNTAQLARLYDFIVERGMSK